MNLQNILLELGPQIEEQGLAYDAENKFAEKNFCLLKENGVYKALIPAELGGGGVEYSELCYFLKDLAHYCPSTSLTLAMHMHLVAVLVFKHLNGDAAATKTLKAVVEKDWILLSTGGGDWVSSNGTARKADGGYIINCRKSFCSGSPIANVAVMTCAYDDGVKEQVLHFSAPLSADGVEIIYDWNAMGMRGTGSNSINFKDVFVPEEKISLIRERGKWHPVWDAVCTLQFPVFISTYAGIVEAISKKTIALFSKREKYEPYALSSLGEMHNHFQIVEMAHKRLVENANNLNIKPSSNSAAVAVQAKSIITNHGKLSAQAAMDSLGGYSYYQKVGIERLYRDLLAGEFHPMQASKQKEMLGNYLVGKTLAG
ncbi:MAG TPA: acyl-CoA dehydrogenase family protein [Bacteroidia bacterium]|nr:acyl-CoA dehydrogenase family protein [Chitinophagaceae bacterium]HLP32238.1 acyl-CoA dehydrogenase family protein [Bacteroidia bacterium]